ncbi:ribosome-binding factor A [Desulfotomaculum arcticum]|uniref:Ribosome-binding factor A n=1 Tax=Desulfotruncus arcticus DSM 17038 TaxID=1121424 RepID=A0A1I2SH91_9FIRM|nr:30S ribosome-binding factor RbfA [Desulfotruncus arcticus]SFG49566.1 ribosome-binding factor A [Desulfotomaculum arcticum] [Desulfotruncus arcticus DSM 17038]
MMSHRPERLAEAIKKEVSDLLREELKDPRIGFATLTWVEVSNDLKYAKIFVSVYGNKEEQKATMAALKKAQGYVRTELGRRIRLRHVPEVSFKLDDSIEHGSKVIKLLDGVIRDNE